MRNNATMAPITASSPRGITKGILHAPQGDAFANAQALLDNGEGKHVDNGTVHFSLSEMDPDGMTQRHKHGTQCKIHGRGYPKMSITSHQHSSEWARQSKGKCVSSIAKKTSTCVGSNNCNNRNSHIGPRIKETLSSQTMLKIARSMGILCAHKAWP